MIDEHIKLRVTDGEVQVVIDDYELFDYLDDLFTENDLAYAHTTEEERDGRRYYAMHFSMDVSEKQISDLLKSVPPEDIARIGALNR